MSRRHAWQDPAWGQRRLGAPPWSRARALVLVPWLLLWTLPQTVVGLALALWHRARGVPWWVYRFGPFVFLVVPASPPASRGISLGLVVISESPAILTHEFCHLYTALWLSWLYLPVYGAEYALLGHARSPHERLTERLERGTRWAWRRWEEPEA